MSPFAQTNGHNFPGLIDQLVPCGAAMLDDVVVVFEDAVRQPVVPHKLPDVLDGVQFRRSRRQEHQGDIVRNFQFRRDMPPGLIEDEHGVRSWIDGAAYFGKVFLHRFGVAIRQDQARPLALFRADRTEDISPHGALVVRG